MRNAKRHTKPCVYFQTGACPLSALECDYAHVFASPEQYAALKNPQATLRTKPCRFYLAGQCKDGYWCRFKHPVNVCASSAAPSETSSRDEVPELESDIGTEDDADVRELDGAWKAKPEQHPKYRTRPCRNYLLGRCVYGTRCSYLHNDSPPPTPLLTLPAGYPTSPSATSYFPSTPPPFRVPNSTPDSTPASAQSVGSGSDFDVEVMDLAAPSLAHTAHRTCTRMRTPSNSSSVVTDEPMTPATPKTPDYAQIRAAPYGAPSFPPSPLSPLSRVYAHPRKSVGVNAKRTDSTMQCPLPLTPPYTVYSPTSPVPLRIMHAPIAVPMYQSFPGENRRPSAGAPQQASRVFSQADVEPERLAQRNANFRSKPCRFFNDFGRCHKGNHCNFMHSETPITRITPISSSPLSPRNKQWEESVMLKQKNPVVDECSQPGSPSSEKPGNFYRINWRVVGGGVKMGTDSSGLRRHSEDTSELSRRHAAGFIDPFSPPITGRPFLGATPVDRKERASSLSLMPAAPVCTPHGSPARKAPGVDNALALNLQSYSLAGARACPPSTQPVIVVQDAGEEKAEWSDEYEDNSDSAIVSRAMLDPGRRDAVLLRAKSSPSTPVSVHLELPNQLFSAESP